MKTNSKRKIIPMAVFAEAAFKLFGCKPEDIHIEITDENRSAFVVYKQEPYQIHTREALYENVKYMLTDPDEAQLIHVPIWLEASVGILSNNLFHLNLVDALKDVQ